jgi:arsenate reductase-like glutaredoxin family protein
MRHYQRKEWHSRTTKDTSKETPCLQLSLLNEEAIAMTQENHLFLIKRPGIDKVAQDKTRLD